MMLSVISPAPRDEWRAVVANDPTALPEHAPEWVDALCAAGSYRDASRYYRHSDGREFVLPLVRRTTSGRGVVVDGRDPVRIPASATACDAVCCCSCCGHRPPR